MELSAHQQVVLLDLARSFIRRALSGEDVRTTSDANPSLAMDPLLTQPAGCFVTLHTLAARRLRGCVGRLESDGTLLEALRSASVNVLSDPRFLDAPVTLDELCELELEVSVISPLRSAEDPLDFEPITQGIYLTIGRHAGCFLPQVARETGWDREQLLERLCTEKMGLPPDAWRDRAAQLSVFTTTVIGPEPFVNT